MTDEEREKITFLRYKGYGYKKTTNTIGLSRDSVRGYCIRNGLDGYGTGAFVNKKVYHPANQIVYHL